MGFRFAISPALVAEQHELEELAALVRLSVQDALSVCNPAPVESRLLLPTAFERDRRDAGLVERDPSARVRASIKRADITPPIGIHNRNWGAALQDTADGIHRPFYVTALALSALSIGNEDQTAQLLITVDAPWLLKTQTDEIYDQIRQATQVEHVIVSLSHTHAGACLARPFYESCEVMLQFTLHACNLIGF